MKKTLKSTGLIIVLASCGSALADNGAYASGTGAYGAGTYGAGTYNTGAYNTGLALPTIPAAIAVPAGNELTHSMSARGNRPVWQHHLYSAPVNDGGRGSGHRLRPEGAWP